MKSKKKGQYRNAYNMLKSHQHLVSKLEESVNNWEVRHFKLNRHGSDVSRRRRSKLGFYQEALK